MTDEFFDDEQELMEAGLAESQSATAQPQAARRAGSRSSKRDGATSSRTEARSGSRAASGTQSDATAKVGQGDEPASDGRRTPPPFWMVLVITAIALLLGVIIGYLAGSSATLSALEASQESMQQSVEATTSDAYALPEGHPQVEVDEDGSAHVTDDATAAQ